MPNDLSNKLYENEEMEYRIWQSAQIVQASDFWQYMLGMFDQETLTCTAELQDHVLNGREKLAMMAASKMHAYNWLLTTIERTVADLAPQDPVEEEMKYGY